MVVSRKSNSKYGKNVTLPKITNTKGVAVSHDRIERFQTSFDQSEEPCHTSEPDLPEIDFAHLAAIAQPESNTRLWPEQRARGLDGQKGS